MHVDVHDAPRGHLHLDLRYLLLAPDDEPAPAPGESQEARWFSWAEADEVADESLRNALRAAARATAQGSSPGLTLVIPAARAASISRAS